MSDHVKRASANLFRVSTPVTLDAAAELARDWIVDVATRRDGVSPLSEASVLARGAPARHLLVQAGAATVGYGCVPTPGGAAEIVVAPWARALGVGTILLQSVVEAGATNVWAHGDLPAAQALGKQFHAEIVRELWQMSRPLAAPAAPAAWEPDAVRASAGVTITGYRGPEDDAGLLAVNAAAFADLPDQGSWTSADVQARVSADWFDPAGLFLARTDAGEIVGFHWTKQHSPTVGEIYVLACDPAWQGRGLGRALIDIGLAHLAARGVRRALLYVDGANTVARSAYAATGFRDSRRDVLYHLDSPAGIARETIRSP